ncbi:putative HNH restriction endonuclease [Caballeronia udeis]|uniref:HNH restriction endonuclease n=1 Tax=Caballeronia udeis TaxID=1232866 RepID=A0ABW8MAM5_9BURK
MDEKISRTIQGLTSWDELGQFKENAEFSGRMTAELQSALDWRAAQLGRILVAQKTGLDLSILSPAQEKIVEAVSRYVAIKTSHGSHASRTFDQLRKRGLIGAAESAVCRSSPTEGFKTLTDANEREISYEQIVVSYPQEFSSRATWFSRRALGLPNAWSTPPVDESSPTQTRTAALLQWLKAVAAKNDGVIPPFSNDDAAAAVGMNDMRTHGRVQGKLQTRIDYACYQVGLPPLGLAVTQPFQRAWTQEEQNWAFPTAAMQRAARLKVWSDADFDNLLRETKQLPGEVHPLWTAAIAGEEEKVKAWAFSFGFEDVALPRKVSSAGRNAPWSRDELILALDLYINHRASPPGKGSPEIVELSNILNSLGSVLGQRTGDSYRNDNGVYMKLMNFRRLDPQYTAEGKKGLTRGNKDEVRVWDEFASEPQRLAEVAQFIRNGIVEHKNDADLSGPDEPGIEEAEEGKVATRVHRYRERDRRLVEEAKAQALKKHGRLFCVACNFDFTNKYGTIGAGIIDVHHTKPVHTMEAGEKTKVSDLVLLCSNCHRVVHSKRKWLTLEQLRAGIGG